jgi:hypothetical protein
MVSFCLTRCAECHETFSPTDVYVVADLAMRRAKDDAKWLAGHRETNSTLNFRQTLDITDMVCRNIYFNVSTVQPGGAVRVDLIQCTVSGSSVCNKHVPNAVRSVQRWIQKKRRRGRRLELHLFFPTLEIDVFLRAVFSK